jgi:hypothetical protein
MAVALRHQLAGALGDGVERDGRVDRVAGAEGLLGVAAIDRGGARIDEAVEARQAARRLEQRQLAGDVRIDVGVGIDQRVADAGLRREMDDAGDLGMRGKEAGDRLAVRDVDAMKGEPCPRPELGQPRLLEGDAVVVV